MTIKQQGGIFGRNPTFKDVEAEDLVVTDNIKVNSDIRIGPANSSQGQIELAKGSGAFMRFRRIDDTVVTGNNIGGMEFYTEDTNSAGVGAIIKGVAGGNGGQVDLQFHTGTGGSTANAMTIEDGGDVIVETGNLVIGTSGQGIDFSATSGTGTSELFDDYEEGTWTPALKGQTTAGAGTYSRQLGWYTKVGNVCHLTFSLVWTAHSGTGTMYLDGLPFNGAYYALNVQQAGTVVDQNLTLTSGHYLAIGIGNSSSRVSLYDQPDGGGANGAISVKTSGTISGQITYRTA